MSSLAAIDTTTEAERALDRLSLDVRRALHDERVSVLRQGAMALVPFIEKGDLHPGAVEDEIYQIANDFGLGGAAGSEHEREIADIAQITIDAATAAPVDDRSVAEIVRRMEMSHPVDRLKHIEPPAVDSFDAFEGSPPADKTETKQSAKPAAKPLVTMTPEAWRGTEPKEMRWFAHGRIPAADVTIYAGNGGSGKTETIVELLISASAGLGDWLGCIVEPGPVLFLSCEEPEENVRDRVERICKHRGIDPYALPDLHVHYPDLEATSLVSVDQRTNTVVKSELFESVIAFATEHRPALIAVDSAAAVFDGDAIARRLVRAFLAMLRKLAGDTGAAIVLLDHPSVRGMSDGTGTANSVDWRNSVRSMMYLSDPDKEDPDVRTLELKKSNRGRTGEKIKLRWNGLTFSTEAAAGGPSPYRAAADREVDELFLQILDKRNAQGRPVRPSSGHGSAPAEMADDPDAKGVKSAAFRAAMERLFTAGKIKAVETGYASKRRKHIERA